MEPNPNLEATINRVRYRVATATLLASDRYWDGSNWERHGRNTFLYRTPRGLYFAVHLSQWQGERDHIQALDVEAACSLYESLPEQEVPPAEAFPTLTFEDA